MWDCLDQTSLHNSRKLMNLDDELIRLHLDCWAGVTLIHEDFRWYIKKVDKLIKGMHRQYSRGFIYLYFSLGEWTVYVDANVCREKMINGLLMHLAAICQIIYFAGCCVWKSVTRAIQTCLKMLIWIIIDTVQLVIEFSYSSRKCHRTNM